MVWLPLNGDLRSLSRRWRLLRLLRWSCCRNLAICGVSHIDTHCKYRHTDRQTESCGSALAKRNNNICVIRRETDLLELVGAPAGGRAFVRAPPPLICPGPGGLKHTNTHCFSKDAHAKEQWNKGARGGKKSDKGKTWCCVWGLKTVFASFTCGTSNVRLHSAPKCQDCFNITILLLPTNGFFFALAERNGNKYLAGFQKAELCFDLVVKVTPGTH